MSVDFETYPAADPEAWQQARVLRSLARLSPTLPLGTLIGCGAIAFYLWPVAHSRLLASCVGAALMLCATLWLAWHIVRRRRTGVLAHDLPLVRRWLLLGSVAVGGFWAATGLAVLPTGSPWQQGIVAFVLAALTALWLPLFALDRATLFTLAAPVLLPMAFALLSLPPADPATTMGSALLLVFAAVVAAARIIERMLDAEGASQRALYHQATHDRLVDLINHAEFDRRVSRLDAVRRGPYAIVFVDLDRFKTVNDTAGHAAGDRLLCKVAEILREEKRKADVAARVGGDEFAILMELCSAHEATRVAHGVLNRIRALRLEHGTARVRVTASIGIACASLGSVTARDVLEAADRACYAAKRAGRNRIELASDDAASDQLPGSDTGTPISQTCSRNANAA